MFSSKPEIITEPLFKKRDPNSHKGTYGTALLFCGSYGMAGAAMLSAKAALRSGLGIAKCVLPKSIYAPFTCFLPEAVCVPLEETENGTLKFSDIDFKLLLTSSDAVLFGCGSGTDKDNEKILEYLLLKNSKPVVLDADGINTLSHSIELLKKSKAPIVLTPHPGEMARLLRTDVNSIEQNREQFSREFATKYGCTLVLKGHETLVAEAGGKLWINKIGNAGMATGGSGDVLAGILVSLCAQGIPPKVAARYAVYLHAKAGDKAAEKRSQHSLIPTDIIEEL